MTRGSVQPPVDHWKAQMVEHSAMERTCYDRGESTVLPKPTVGDGVARYGHQSPTQKGATSRTRAGFIGNLHSLLRNSVPLQNKDGHPRFVDLYWSDKKCVIPTFSVTPATVLPLPAEYARAEQ